MASIWQKNGGVFLGFACDRLEGAPPPFQNPLRYADDRHICLIGPNGSGKTKRLLVPALHDLTDYSCVVNDIKGELCTMTEAYRRAKGNRVIILNPFNVNGLGSSGVNPVASLGLDDEFPDNALELAEAVIRATGKELHWSHAAQEITAAIIMYVRIVIENGSFADVRALLSQDHHGIRRMILGGSNVDPRQYELFQDEPKSVPKNYVPPFRYEGKLYPGMLAVAHLYNWPEIAAKSERFSDINPENRELLSVLGTALTQTRWLDSRPIKADLAKGAFDFSELKINPTTVYLILPANRLGTHSGWIRLMVTSVVQKLIRDANKPRVPVLLMMDEYAALAGGESYGSFDSSDGFPIIARNMPMFRGYGIKLWSVFQDLSQMKRIYGDGAKSFMANTGVLQIFGAQDTTTADYASKRSGQRTVPLPSSGATFSPNPSMPGGRQWTENINLGYIQMPLLLPEDIRNMDAGFSLIYTNLDKGPVRSFVPWPGDMPHLREIMKLDPSN